jgi:hypothetical protein
VFGEIVRDEGMFGITNELDASDLAAANLAAGMNDTDLNHPTLDVPMLDLSSAKVETDGELVHHYFKVYRQFTTSGEATVQWSVGDSYFSQVADQTSYLYHPSSIQANMHVLTIADLQDHFDYTNYDGGATLGSAQIKSIWIDSVDGGSTLLFNTGTIESPNWQSLNGNNYIDASDIIDGRLAYTGTSLSMSAEAEIFDGTTDYWTGVDGSGSDISVTFTVTSSAIDYAPGQDFLENNNGLPSGTAIIPDGESFTIIDIVTIGNPIGADNKTFSINIHDPSAGSSVGNDDHSDGFIGNDDPLFSIGLQYPNDSEGSSSFDHGSQVRASSDSDRTEDTSRR